MKKIKDILAGFLIVLFVAGTARSDPSISSHSGTWAHGRSIVITGTNFGTKATAPPAVFDSFDSNDFGRQDGDQIKNKNCSHYGKWEDYSNDGAPTYTNAKQKRGSTLSSYHPMAYDTSNNHCPMVVDYSAGHSGTLLLDFWMRFTQSGVTDTAAGAKNFKMFRIISDGAGNWNTANGYNKYVSFNQSYYIQKDADSKVGYFKMMKCVGDPPSNQTWPTEGDTTLHPNIAADGTWNHVTVFQKAGTSDTADGSAIIWVDGTKLEDTSSMVNWNAQDVWAAACFGWYIANVTSGNYYTQFDDIYIDTYWQSVWIGNASTWANCTHREIQIPATWADTSITITVNRGSFDLCQTYDYYLYVVDADGNVNSNGYPISIVAGSSDPPCPPTGFRFLQ